MRAGHVLFLLTVGAAATASATDVAVCTDRGRFVIELADDEAPKQVENFLRYVDTAFYSGLVFHRALGDLVQGGGFDRELRGRPVQDGVENESGNGLKNVRGAVAAARRDDPNSATSQFFVNLADHPALDGSADPGYTVFGRVTEGIEVLDEIGRLPTGRAGQFAADVPLPLVAIGSIARLDEAELAQLPADGREAALEERIAAAAAAQDFAAALRWVDHYRAICGAPSADIVLTEVNAALETNRRQRAVNVLEELFATTDDSDPAYQDAVALYRTARPAAGECTPPLPPPIPDGNTATTAEMVAGQAAVRSFVSAAQTYLDCVGKIIDDAQQPRDTRNTAVAEHNRMVEIMETVAGDFNSGLRAFRTRE